MLFCDLVDSTVLARQLDPEDYREVVRAYQATCGAVIQRFDGYIAQYLGDGLLVYFGYPQAHEDDAQRAVRAGLEMLDALAPLQARLAADKGIRLAVRLGIHTGLVVVGAIGAGGRQEALALGDTPNVAARLQGLATPDTVVVSDATWRLVQGYFAGHDLGPQTLKGVETPVQVYRVLGTSGAQSRLDVVNPRGLTPLVGREAEMTLLRERWAQARDGLGQVVLLSGEAGIGKSRLVQGLQEHIAAEPHTRLEWRCSPYAQQSPLHPVIEHLHRLLHLRPDDVAGEKAEHARGDAGAHGLGLPEVVPLLAALLSLPLPERYPSLNLTPQRQRQKTLEALLTWLLAESARAASAVHCRRPALDRSLDAGIPHPLPRPGTNSPPPHAADVPPGVSAPWGFRSHLTPLTLNRLPRPQVPQMIGRITGGKALPPEVVEQIVAKTDGVPLFVEELTKMVLESGCCGKGRIAMSLQARCPPWPFPPRCTIPSWRGWIAWPRSKTWRNWARPSDARLPTSCCRRSRPWTKPRCSMACGNWWRPSWCTNRVCRRRRPTRSSMPSSRMPRISRCCGAPASSITSVLPNALAEAVSGDYQDATRTIGTSLYRGRLQRTSCRLLAGQRAIERLANVEAITHLNEGLEALKSLPDTSSHIRQELVFQIALGVPLAVPPGALRPRKWNAPMYGARASAGRWGEPLSPFRRQRDSRRLHLVRGECRLHVSWGAAPALNLCVYDPLGIGFVLRRKNHWPPGHTWDRYLLYTISRNTGLMPSVLRRTLVQLV